MLHFLKLVFFVFKRAYRQNIYEQENQSTWWNNVGSIIGSMFVGDEERRRLMMYLKIAQLTDGHF